MRRSRRKLKATTPESPVFDQQSNTVDIWPIMAASASDLAAEIERGDHDGYLSLLQHCDQARFEEGRAVVQMACNKRRAG